MSNEFQQLNLEQLAAESHRVSTNDGFLEQFAPLPKTGAAAYRILPPLKGTHLYQYNRVHSVNGKRHHCPRPLVNGKFDHKVPCPICQYVRSLWRKIDRPTEQGDTDQVEKLKDEARAIAPVERYYYNVIVRNYTNEDGAVQRNVGPRILSVGKVLHKAILTGIVGDNMEKGYGNVTDLKHGRDFIVKVNRKGEFPDYARSCFAQEPSPAGTAEEVAKWRQTLHDLSKLRCPKSYEDLERELAVYKGFLADDTEYDLEALQQKYQSAAEEDAPSPASGELANAEEPNEQSQSEEEPLTEADFETDLDVDDILKYT